MIPDVLCSTCVFFSEPPIEFRDNGRPSKGQCRRHAPSLDRNEGSLRTTWPLVGAMQWCGEHSHVEAASEAA